MRTKRLLFIFLSAVVLIQPLRLLAQEEGDEAESFFTKQEDDLSKEPTLQEPKKDQPKLPQSQGGNNGQGSGQVKELSDLGNLAPFKDIAVLQKRYLPKTGRFEVFGAVGSTINDAFFIDATINARLGYYFTERYGIEFTGMYINSSQRQVTTDLSGRGVTTKSLVSPNNYYGLDFKWTPIYGKMAFKSTTLTPFDMYFSVGGGETGTANGNNPSLHLGTGQIFAMSKAFALRWDFTWNFYTATTYADAAQTVGSTSLYNNLFILIGASWFFPEATYR